MANYKVVDADRLDTDLASVADSIRTKTGVSGELEFPADFKSAIDGIEVGSSSALPDNARLYYFGNADSTMTMPIFTSSASGKLT